MRADERRYFGISAVLGSLVVAALVACASDAPDDAPASDAGLDASFLADAAAPDAEAGVALGDVCGPAEGLEPGAPWPTRGGCPKRAGVSTNAGPTVAAVKWILPIAAGESSPAIAADQSLWVGTTSGDIVSLSADGAVQAALAIGGPVRSSPARTASGLTIVAGGDGKLHAVEREAATLDAGTDAAADGGDAGDVDGGYPPARAVWSRTIGPAASSPAIGKDGTVYVGTATGMLVAVAADGRTTKWSANTHDTLGSTPCISSDGTIYVGSSDHGLYAFAADGSLKWRFETGDGAAGSPIVAGDETVYVGASNGMLYAVTPGGKVRWAYATGGAISGSPAVRAGFAYVGSDDKRLHAVATDTGQPAWTFETRGAVATPVIGPDGTVYVGSADGNLYAVAPSGLLFFAVRVNGKVRSAPAIGAVGTLYVTTDTAIVAIGQ